MSAQAPTHSSNINQTAPKPVSQPKLELDIKSIGKYEVRPSILGDGGFCSVYACQCPSSESGTATVAVKLSTSPVHEFDNDKWVSHRREWQAYQSLCFGRTAEGQSAGIPAVYECKCLTPAVLHDLRKHNPIQNLQCNKLNAPLTSGGLVKTNLGIHTWISMQLLGKDIRTLASKGQAKLSSDFMPLASGMLAALQHVHSKGIVHRDIKPANFCLGAGSNSKKLLRSVHQQVFIVDFGFASHVPSKEKAMLDSSYGQMTFGGTPDYASRDTLRGHRCSPKPKPDVQDDLESLGYCFLEMLQEDLPWYLTLKKKPSPPKESMKASPSETSSLSKETSPPKITLVQKSFHAGDCFSHEQLCEMAEARELMWLQLCSEDKIPAFLVSWLEYVRTLGMYDTPSYAWLMRLLEHSQDPASGNTKRRRTSAAEDVIDIKKQKMDVYAPEE